MVKKKGTESIMSDNKSWYSTGYDELDREIEQIETRKSSSKFFRFWLKPGEECEITFLSNEPFICREHNLNINGRWGNFYTCLSSMNLKCPLCDAGESSYLAGFFPIIDHRSFTDKNGVEYSNQVKIFVAKVTTLKKLKKQSERRKSIEKAKFLVNRLDGEKSLSVGDDFEFIEMVENFDELYSGVETVIPFEEILAPKSPEALKRLIAPDVSIAGGEMDDVPF